MANLLNLDANASFGLHPEVEEALRSLSWDFHNPSSIHRGGQAARAAIEEARSSLASLIALERGQRLVFTSGATEANNMAISFASLREGGRPPAGALVVSALEHPSTLEPARALAQCGRSVTFLSPGKRGSFDADPFANAITPQTVLCSCMLANNETGHIYPLLDIATAVRARNDSVLVHTDAVQALGKIPFSFSDLGVDLCSLSGHKIGALAGVGALVLSDRCPPLALIKGGPQETRWRAGTENVLGIISFGVAARLAERDLQVRASAMRASRDYFWSELQRELPHARFNTPVDGLPNTCHVTIPGIRADDLVVALDLEGILISSGAACASGKPEPSHVLLALGMDEAEASASVRISMRGGESREALRAAVLKIKSFAGRVC